MLKQMKTLTQLTAVTLTMSSCGGLMGSLLSTENIQQENLAGSGGQSISRLSVNLNKYPANKVVCDPLSGGQTSQTNFVKGIKASLHYRAGDIPRFYKSTDYVDFARKSEQNIFLSDMNIPTRMFTEGFSPKVGEVLKDDQGQKLIEYFGLKMSTNIVLADSDEEGVYEFALLSDNGTQMKLKSGSEDVPDEMLIDNDGDHPTRMGCSVKTVKMRRNVMVPVEVTYYQGPRYHIANVLIWRKATEAGKDSLCGHSGNNLFYDPDHNSNPLQAVKDLESRGWKVLVPDNFMMSADDYNPCVNGTNPVISNFALGEVILQTVTLSWTTDIAATSQVEITNIATGEVTLTGADNILRTEHQVRLTSLKANTAYKVKAISVSSDLGRSVSTELTFQTQ